MTESPGLRGRAATRTRILRAAEALFGRAGFEGTTVRRIAQDCGLTNAALYYYFTSKQDILNALVAEFRAAPVRVIDGSADGRMSWTTLERAADGMLDLVAEHSALYRLVRRRALAGDSVAIEARARSWTAWREFLVAQFDRRFALGDAERLADTFIAMLGGVIFLETAAHGERTPERLRDAAFRRQIHAMIRLAVPLDQFAHEQAASA